MCAVRASRVIGIVLVGMMVGCAEPPTREINQAQGAIDAARAAGADQYAGAELQAAVDALQRAEDAVGARDYRLALNHALDSRERAQTATKQTVNARARSRGDAERAIAEVSTLVAQALVHLRDPATTRAGRRNLQQARETVDTAQKSLQEARTALNADDYPRAVKAVDGMAARLRAALANIDDTPTTRRPR
jgi:hypothetical protein